MSELTGSWQSGGAFLCFSVVQPCCHHYVASEQSFCLLVGVVDSVCSLPGSKTDFYYSWTVSVALAPYAKPKSSWFYFYLTFCYYRVTTKFCSCQPQKRVFHAVTRNGHASKEPQELDFTGEIKKGEFGCEVRSGGLRPCAKDPP